MNAVTLKIAAAASASALLLSACQPRTAPNDDPKPTPAAKALAADANELNLCRSVKDASEGAKAALQAAIFTDPDGQRYGGETITALMKKDHPRFAGTELNAGHCWAYMEATGVVSGLTRNLSWRCPITAIRDDPAHIDRTVLEDVDGEKCDFNAVKGTDTKQVVTEQMTRLSF